MQVGFVDIADVIVGTIGDDGTIVSWVDAAPLPEARFHLSAALVGDVIYVTGGLGLGNTSRDTVWSSAMGADGTLSPWQQVGPMSRSRSHHASFAYQGMLFVAGGLDGQPAGAHDSLSDVQGAPAADGGLGAWSPLGTLPSAVSTHSAAVVGRCAILPGGIDDGSMHSTSVRMSELDGAGTGTWSLAPSTLPAPRSHVHQAPQLGDHLYLVGGSVGLQQVTDAVTVGTLEPPPG